MNSTGMDEGCVFCRELAGSRDTNFAQRYPEITGRIVAQTDLFVAFPCIGQLRPGHFLVVPRKHMHTIQDVFSEASQARGQLNKILTHVHGVLGMSVDDSLFFEHGTIGSESGGCGIYHAHLHVVPSAGDIPPGDIFEFDEDTLGDPVLYSGNVVSHGAYVLVGSTRHGYFQKRLTQPLPSQTLRRNVARALGVVQWDWRLAHRETAMLSLIASAEA